MKKILMTTLLLLSTSSYASQINVQALEACSLVENDLKRLMCYDKVMAGKQINLSSHDQQKKESKETPTHLVETTSDNFGLEKKTVHKVDEIRSKITALKLPKVGEKTITLENGQVWKQTDSDSFRAKIGDTVIIKRASLGSFLMKKKDSNRTIRVKRLK